MSVTDRYVVMGVTGAGKSRIGAALADDIGASFVDGDALHPATNIAKMSRGEPLDDEDRAPWIKSVGETLAGADGPIVVACSALKRSYRDKIREIAGGTVFLFLDGSRDVLAGRIAEREGHFMPSELLDSQLRTLEPPEVDEKAFAVDVGQSAETVISILTKAVKGIRQ
ncbi:gluconokinase [Cucumibacter marinus]|uniref:gluconokinase n=1 Tax=Cucumibacter marinus TaxID=1121252 RepID=UPI00048FEE07|nr:gluconokinase [Cucumibacter marinus]